MEVRSLGREDSLEKGNGYPFQYSCLENPMDRGAYYSLQGPTELDMHLWAGSRRVKGTQENCSPMWLAVSGFMEMALVSGLCLASHLAWPIV